MNTERVTLGYITVRFQKAKNFLKDPKSFQSVGSRMVMGILIMTLEARRNGIKCFKIPFESY